MALLEGMRKMTAWLGQGGRKSLMAIAVIALFLFNLNVAWADGDDNAWPGPASAATLSSSSASIGDRVWHDENGNGDQNENFSVSEPGFNDVRVCLYSNSDEDANFEPGGDDTEESCTLTMSGTSRDPDGWSDGIYGFDMNDLGLDPGEYWVWVDESTLPSSLCGWYLTTGSNPQKVTYTGSDNFSIDFGYEPLACPAGEPTAITLSSFMASSASGGASHWPGLAVLATLAAGGTLWTRRR